MEKLERDVKVAVVFSTGHGDGWSTRNHEYYAEMCMDAEIAQAVLDDDVKKAAEIAVRKYPGVYVGGADNLKVMWLNQGTRFEVDEYYGDEWVRVVTIEDFLVA